MILKIIFKKIICSSLKYGLFSLILVSGFVSQTAYSADVDKTPQGSKEISTFLKTDSDLPNLDNQPDNNTTLQQVEELEEENAEESDAAEASMEQVTNVSQLTDVEPTDWAYEALRSLIERYGCIAGYPDSTYRGNRALTRYEFAAGLNACLEQITNLVPIATADGIRQEELATLQRLQSEFAIELASLRGSVGSLEARTAEIEATQFSTTTKLSGLTIVGVQGRSNNRADLFPRDGKKETDDRGTNINVINFNQLYLTTQFDERSYLLAGLQASQGTTAPRLTNDVLLSYELFNDNDAILSDLNYRFLLTDKFAVLVGTEGVNMAYAFRGPNRVESAATGPISAFAQRNPILNIGFGRGGIGFDWQFAKRASLQAVYSTTIPGFFHSDGQPDGHNTAGVQLALTPTDPLDITLYYVNDYSPNGSLLTGIGDDQLSAINPLTGNSASLQTNAVGATINWRITPRISLGGWAGYTNSHIPGRSGNVKTTNYMVYLNFPDLFGQGNLGGIYIGQPPKIVSSDLPVGNNIPDFFNTGLGREGGQPGTTTHVEAFYRWQATDNISITPGVVFIFEPGHTPASDPIAVGILRTSFSF
ncbi:iron uptake porin [Coleofasciculus sp. FACHB-T130]|uniref:iron uptake porin n=1 Tax=Cyanophyceae TaxID=3028117 RepID=UPI00168A08D4|nr:iron uptake porin [Coleofasciculus sp. FACHB-T130]MBD1882056.1 carbohydrate porin [Coleofasciculus sp. FACHB-T130]